MRYITHALKTVGKKTYNVTDTKTGAMYLVTRSAEATTLPLPDYTKSDAQLEKYNPDLYSGLSLKSPSGKIYSKLPVTKISDGKRNHTVNIITGYEKAETYMKLGKKHFKTVIDNPVYYFVSNPTPRHFYQRPKSWQAAAIREGKKYLLSESKATPQKFASHNPDFTEFFNAFFPALTLADVDEHLAKAYYQQYKRSRLTLPEYIKQMEF